MGMNPDGGISFMKFSSIMIIFSLLITILICGCSSLISNAELTIEDLDTHSVDYTTMITSMVVKNTGSATAHNVRIYIVQFPFHASADLESGKISVKEVLENWEIVGQDYLGDIEPGESVTGEIKLEYFKVDTSMPYAKIATADNAPATVW